MGDFLQNLAPPAVVTGQTLVAYTLLDIFLIVVLARILGNLFLKISQPRVVGEILAGILLGPTLLGENLSQVITPLEVRPVLSAVATVALILFMFLAGAEFDASRVKGRIGQACVLACASVAVPALLGFPVARALHSDAFIGPVGESFLPFALLMGAALSVTAFPIMAHILMERGELNTPLGSLGVATAGVTSVLMFLYIAFAAASAAAAGFDSFLLTIGLIVVFGLGSWFVVRPLLGRVLPGMFQDGILSGSGVALVFGGMLLYGLITHVLDINAMVGGFAWGLILPADLALRQHLADKVRDVALILLLPVFFAIAGFSTDLKLLDFSMVPAILLVLVAAVAGKFLAAAPARAFSLSWREAGILGALFNTRGLLVMVVGLIGLDLEIITTLTFTILVVMALVANLMTLPLLDQFTVKSEQQIANSEFTASYPTASKEGKLGD
jgi:Kef-type K+ transport system membrane component KefB